MSALDDIYQEVILDHYRRPRNCAALPAANHQARGHNPLCGDKVTVYLKVAGGVVEEVSFEGAGCAISTASASLMTEAVKGLTVAEAEDLFRRFRAMLTEEGEAEDLGKPELGKLEAFAGVRQIPIRVKCATLAWHTLKAALDSEESGEPVSTE